MPPSGTMGPSSKMGLTTMGLTTMEELAASGDRYLQHGVKLGIVVINDLTQQEDGALRRCERFRQDREGQRKRCAALNDHELWSPRRLHVLPQRSVMAQAARARQGARAAHEQT